MIGQVITVANQTFREIYQSKILLNVLILGFVIGGAIFLSSELTYGAPSRIGLDVGLGVLSISSVGIAMFMGATLIDKEIKNRTLYMVISRPVSRHVFYMGKMLGLSGILLINILLLCLFVLGLYSMVGGHWHYLILWSVGFILLESLVIMFSVVFFSLISNTIVSVLITLTIYVAGHAVESVKETMLFKTDALLSNFIDLYSKLMPNLSKFNIKAFVLYNGKLTDTFLYTSFGYGILWIIIFATCSAFIINKKDFS